MFIKIKPVVKSSVIKSSVTVIVAIFAVGAIVFAWTEPSVAPPDGNVAPPLNAGAIGQSKTGNLALNTDGELAYGLLVPFGNVGIGTVTPSSELSIVGDIMTGITLENSGGYTGRLIVSGGTVFVGGSHASVGLALQAGGANRLYIDPSGNVGIGTASPGAHLEIFDSSGASIRVGQTANAGLEYSRGSGNLYLGGDNGQPGNFYIKNSGGSTQAAISSAGSSYFTGGNVGIGTASPGYKLDVQASAVLAANIFNSYNSELTIYGLTVQAVNMNPAGSGVGISGVGSGSFGVGVRGSGGQTGVEGSGWGSNTAGVRGSSGAAGGAVSYGVLGANGWPGGYGIYCNVSGGAGCGGNSGWSVSSDGRLKTNIETISDALDKVLLLRGVNFNWKDPEMEDDLKMGFVAQEVLPVIPELVKLDANGYYTMEQAPLTALLVEAIKELKAENENLKSRIEALENEKK